jgi:Gas vesicle synthesis protein GvpL/GvpF
MSELGWYVYCVVRPGQRLAFEGVPGVDPAHAVEELVHGDLSAAVSRVRLEEFGSEALKRNLEDLAWLERTARAHDGVLARALAAEAVVPLRLCTIFADGERVREMLHQERAFLLDALRRLSGRDEWGVKLLADRQVIEDAVREGAAVPAGVGSRAASGGAPDGAGRAFFARKKLEQVVRDEAWAIAEAAAEETHGELSRQAVAAVLLPPQDPRLSRRAGEMVLNGAYLVDRLGRTTFASALDELRGRDLAPGLAFELSGPFAPYNFVTPPEEPR